MTKFRILSDIHIDVNKNMNFKLRKYKNHDFIDLIAGDICGNQNQAIEWLKNNIHGKCYFVEGNHIFYSHGGMTLQDRQNILKQAFENNDSIFFVENTCHEIDDNVYIIGATLWTDFSLFLTDTNQKYDLEDYMYFARYKMNDYRWGYYFDEKKCKSVNLLPEHLLHEFEKSFSFINEQVNKHPDSKIVILTHHAPSLKSVPKKYQHDIISCAYASNLENFIRDHDNIKLWVHGHCHEFKDYMIGNCRVVCNPYGYRQYGEETGYQKKFIVEI